MPRATPERQEVPVKGRVSFDARLRLLSVDLETDDGEYSTLNWAFDEESDADSWDDLVELLDPSPLEDL